jgi:YHS domain-containing protein
MKNTFLFIVALLSLTATAQSKSKRIASFNLESNLAIQGYDPVAYFIQKKAVEGKSNLTTTYDGVIYNFSSKANKDLFVKNPASFEPQYGGWCAYAMGSSGEKVEIEPKTFKIIDNKLYLFYNAFFNNTLKSWNKDENNLKKKADLNWKKFEN